MSATQNDVNSIVQALLQQAAVQDQAKSEPTAIYLPEPKAEYCVLDIETADAPPEAIERAMDGWKPPSNYKDPDKIEAKRKEEFDKIMSRGALLDASPIICVCMATETERTCFVVSYDKPEIEGWKVYASDSEFGLLLNVKGWLDEKTDDATSLVGHNVLGFDLPKLRNAYIRHRFKLPECLKPRNGDGERQPITDTAILFKYFSMEHRGDFCPSLADMCASLGIEHAKSLVSGADVPRLFKDGRMQEIATYCAVDTLNTLEAYKLMTGRS